MTRYRRFTAWNCPLKWSVRLRAGYCRKSKNGSHGNLIYPFVFMDCIHYKVREDGRILSRATSIVLGINADGYKDILSITVGANETSKFWLGMLNNLKNRGMQDVLFFGVDGLAGFREGDNIIPRITIRSDRKTERKK